MLDDCHSIGDLRDRARRRLPAAVFDLMDGAAETEITARRNIDAFDDVKVVPACLVNVSSVRTSTQLLGQRLEWPLICSPTGGSRFFDPQGELAVARAAKQAGTLYSLSMASSYSLEEVAAASDAPKMFQVLICKNRDFTRALVERARHAGYAALCVTISCPVGGKCERDLRAGLLGSPFGWSTRTTLGFVRHPWWVIRRLGRSTRTLGNFAGPDGKPASLRMFGQQFDPSVTWKDVREILDLWNGPAVVKGVMSADDARRAADAGFSAVMVSNHGGRQLDGAMASLEALPEIVRAVGDRMDVILDGGIRRGVHILKALALGAKACSVGRPYLYGLAAGGQAGVTKALSILRTELVRAMQLSGCQDLADIDSHLIRTGDKRFEGKESSAVARFQEGFAEGARHDR